MKRRWHAIAAAFILAAVLIATGSAVIHKPLPKPEPVMPPRIRLNDRLENGMSEIPALAGLDRKVKAFMGKWQLNGVSLAVMRNDSLLYAKGYGWADKENSDGSGAYTQDGIRLKTAYRSRNNGFAGQGFPVHKGQGIRS